VQKYFLSFAIVCVAFPALAGEHPPLEDLTLEDLTQLKVYSASKKTEDQLFSPSAIYVITANDLQQMGATNIVDALRTVPGIEVAKLSANKWMVASRGFGEQFSNKLLVLIDGRPIYSNLFSGVLWNQNDLVLDNIKQIEVIRGPGASIWGSNAVNGVINIITKNSSDTQGNYVNALAGDQHQIAEYRSGVRLSETDTTLLSFKFRNEENFAGINEPRYQDHWDSANASFRWDKESDYRNSYSLIGNINQGHEEQLYKLPILAAPFSLTTEATDAFKGFYVIGNVQKGLEDKGDLHITSYIDYTNWKYALGRVEISNYNIDAQHDIALNERNEFSWGIGTKIVSETIRNTPWYIYTPNHKDSYYLNTFFQDQIALIPKKLFLNIGTKLESNTFVSFANQPSAKLAWHIDQANMLWASVARALRIPSLGTRDLSLQVLATPGGYISQIGNNYFKPEELIAYEVGFKSTPTTGVYLDLTGYFNRYDQLRTFELGPAVGNIALPFNISNKGEADVYGLEAHAKWQATSRLWLSAGYSLARLSFSLAQNTNDQIFLQSARKWPEQMFHLRTSQKIFENVTFNTSLYYNDSLPSIAIKSQTKIDANISWEVLQGLELSVAGENLFMPEHQEYATPLFGFPNRIGPSYYARITATF
jgi:iron complex outermembrane recepter protein